MSLPRRATFDSSPGHAPKLNHPYAHAIQRYIDGPLSFFNPTRAIFEVVETAPKHDEATLSSQTGTSPDAKGDSLHVGWRARDNRKGRHILKVPRTATTTDYPQLTSHYSAVGKGIWRMCTVFAWWDVSWWIAVLFSVGSAIFVASGFFYWLPLEAPSTEFPDEGTIAGGVTAFIGATLFTIGGVLLIVEATNENQTGCFGWAVEHALGHTDSDLENAIKTSSDSPAKPTVATNACLHHHATGLHHRAHIHRQHPTSNRKWEWWPTWTELRDHYFHEIGFLASFILSTGAVIFYVSGIMALPGIYNNLSQGVLWGIYWLAYLVGGVLFVVSSVLYVLETQPTWYTPAPHLLGWWIGVWNLIGSVGWTLSASFGYSSKSWCVYQSNLSLLWASVAFLVGSLILWYEALDKNVVEKMPKK